MHHGTIAIRPETMFPRVSAHGGSLYGRGEKFRASEQIGKSASLSYDELQPGKLILRLNAADVSPSSGLALLSEYQCIASYNWLDRSEPTIVVPGKSISC